MHLQYFLAGELPLGYDDFRLTAGYDCLVDSAGVVNSGP